MSTIVSPARITIANAQFYAYHGVKKEEQAIGGKFEVDLDVIYDSTKAVLSDDVNSAVNYEEALFCISEVMNGDPYNIIETVAYEINNMVMERFPQVLEVTCRVRKLHAPLRSVVDYVECEQTVQRA